jgi:hypothetical protein
MISVDWPQLIGALLIGVSGIGGISYGGKLAWAKWRSLPSGETPIPPGRAADEEPPPGSVEWVRDTCTAMSLAPDSLKLAALQAGATRDKARSMWIAELEAKA